MECVRRLCRVEGLNFSFLKIRIKQFLKITCPPAHIDFHHQHQIPEISFTSAERDTSAERGGGKVNLT